MGILIFGADPPFGLFPLFGTCFNLDPSLIVWVGDWVGRWSEKKLMLNSTQLKPKLSSKFELRLAIMRPTKADNNNNLVGMTYGHSDTNR